MLATKKYSRGYKNINIKFDADGDGKIETTESEIQDRNWRADPKDGLRPLIPDEKNIQWLEFA